MAELSGKQPFAGLVKKQTCPNCKKLFVKIYLLADHCLNHQSNSGPNYWLIIPRPRDDQIENCPATNVCAVHVMYLCISYMCIRVIVLCISVFCIFSIVYVKCSWCIAKWVLRSKPEAKIRISGSFWSDQNC